MKRMRFLLALMVSSLLLASCQKPEGDDIPVVDIEKTLECSIDTAGVLSISLKSESNQGVVLELVKLYYVKNQNQMEIHTTDTDSLEWKSVYVKNGTPFLDTLWGLEPNTPYKYYLNVKDFVSATVADTIVMSDWRSFRTLNPGNPTVTADSAKIEQDTLWLYGTVKSHWRALMDKDGLGCETSFYWGSTEDGVKDHVVTADVEIDTLINGSLRLNAKGFVPVSDLQGMDAIWYQAHAKHVWGEGEKDSDKKSKTLP